MAAAACTRRSIRRRLCWRTPKLLAVLIASEEEEEGHEVGMRDGAASFGSHAGSLGAKMGMLMGV
jgi:hypothetical protein